MGLNFRFIESSFCIFSKNMLRCRCLLISNMKRRKSSGTRLSLHRRSVLQQLQPPHFILRQSLSRKKNLNAVPLLTCWSLNIQARFWGNYLQSKTPFWALDLANEYPKKPLWGKKARKNLSTHWNDNDQVFRVFTIYLEIFEIKKSDSITGSWNRKVARPSDKKYWSKTCWGIHPRPRASSLRKYPLSIANDNPNKIIYQARNTFLQISIFQNPHSWCSFQRLWEEKTSWIHIKRLWKNDITFIVSEMVCELGEASYISCIV